jgi:preprotein translocase subunit SecA
VHLIASGDRLAGRDAARMAPLLEMLGVTTGVLRPGQTPQERRTAYAAGVTYGTVAEFGSGFLHDNLARTEQERVQRGHGLAIIDETATVLMIEAATPLSAVGPADDPGRWPTAAARLVRRLRRGDDGQGDYEVDEDERTIELSDAGVRQVEDWFGIEDLYAPGNARLLDLIGDALRARELYREGRDYVVEGEEIRAIDPITGQVHSGRFGGGVHEALEAAAGVPVREEGPVYATVTVRGYLREYARLAGVTVTAGEGAREAYRRAYGLEVVTVPTHRPMIRVDHPDAVHATEDEQLAAVVDEVAARHAVRQPVLVSTVPEGRAVLLSRMLDGRKITHELVRPRDDERDAHALADAGRLGAVTVVNRPAGRAMDVMLGGAGATERAQVIARGGLCVIGTERFFEVDDERLRGWAGRRGDPGESMFVLRADDRGPHVLDPAAFEHVLRYEEVRDQQARLFRADRRAVVEGTALRPDVRRMIDELADELVEDGVPAGFDIDDLRGLRETLATIYPVSVTAAELAGTAAQGTATAGAGGRRAVAGRVRADMHAAYDARETALGDAATRDLERRVLLTVMDREWCAYLRDVAHLERGAGRRRIGARLSLEEYRLEAGLLYDAFASRVRRRSIGYLFNLRVGPSGGA